MRILKGKFAGRHLTSPADRRVRPTSELLRDAMLGLLEKDLPGARVLDLFAGTGALGLEAISRGAKSADFVEFRPASLHALKANVAALRLLDRTRIFKKDAVPWTAALAAGSYDIAFADPPYESTVLDRIVEMWKRIDFSRVLIAEHAASHTLPTGGTRTLYGESGVTVYRRKS